MGFDQNETENQTQKRDRKDSENRNAFENSMYFDEKEHSDCGKEKPFIYRNGGLHDVVDNEESGRLLLEPLYKLILIEDPANDFAIRFRQSAFTVIMPIFPVPKISFAVRFTGLAENCVIVFENTDKV
jgi:hypothetical protein